MEVLRCQIEMEQDQEIEVHGPKVEERVEA